MKKLNLLPILVLIALVSFSCSNEDSMDAPSQTTATNNTETSNIVIPEAKDLEIEILELINEYRINKGLNTLLNMDLIKYQAYNHTGYMVDNNNVSHDNFFQRKNYLVANAGAIKVAENVAYGFTSARSVVDAWIKSDSHRVNIEGDFTNFDISAEKNENGEWYYTNIFVKK